METRLGILLWNQATGWDEIESAAVRIDELGYDHIWAWDHLYAIFGDPYQPIFEGYASLAAYAKVTRTARLGLLVGANTFRNPGLTDKLRHKISVLRTHCDTVGRDFSEIELTVGCKPVIRSTEGEARAVWEAQM